MSSIKRKRLTPKTPLMERVEYKYSLALSYLNGDRKLDVQDVQFKNLLSKCVKDKTEEYAFDEFYENYFLKYNLKHFIIVTRNLPIEPLYYVDCLIISSCQKFCIEGGFLDFDKNYIEQIELNYAKEQEYKNLRKIEEQARDLFDRYINYVVHSGINSSRFNIIVFSEDEQKYDYKGISRCNFLPYKRTRKVLRENNMDIVELQTSFKTDLEIYLGNSKLELKNVETFGQVEIEDEEDSKNPEPIVSKKNIRIKTSIRLMNS